MMLEAGEGMPRDLDAAAALYAQAAAQLNVAAMLNLTCLYLEVRFPSFLCPPVFPAVSSEQITWLQEKRFPAAVLRSPVGNRSSRASSAQ